MIEIADTVKHHPTGETWTVARVTDTSVYPAGWPPCCAELKDCELVEKATSAQRARMIEDCKKLPRSDSRHIETATQQNAEASPVYNCPKCGRLCSAETGYTDMVKGNLIVYCSQRHAETHRKTKRIKNMKRKIEVELWKLR